MNHLARHLARALVLLGAATALDAQTGQQTSGPLRGSILEARFLAKPSLGTAPLDVTFEDRSIGTVTAWRWDFGDGSTSSARNPSHTYLEGGLYTVRLSVRRRDGLVDTLVREDAVVVSSCPSGNARENLAAPFELGHDFVPVTGDDRLGFYVVYSGKAQGPGNPTPTNNVGMFLFPLAGDEVLLFGSGYGDPNALVEPTGDASWDVQRIDGLIRFCLGGAPGRTRVRFVAPHGHLDHINADCLRELRRRGYEIPEIVFHQGDAGLVQSLPGWTAQDQAAFRTLRGTTGACQEELLAYDSPLGKIWFYSRPGHTPGAIDLALDIEGDPANRFIVRGSAGIFGTCPIPDTREAIDPHGNIRLSARAPALDSLSPAHASALGNTTVSLFGSGFAARGAAPLRVLVDGVDASEVQVLDDRALTCRIPIGTPGSTAELRILSRNGQDVLASGLPYRPAPQVTAVAPGHGLASGGTLLTVSGTGFQAFAAGPCSVQVGGQPATGVLVLDDGTLTCLSPTLPAGLAEVRVDNLNGEGALPAAFRVDPLVGIDEVAPLGGTALGGTPLVVLGQNFAVGASVPRVFVGSREASDVVRTSDVRLECTCPAGTAGLAVDVRVVAENGETTLPGGFRYHATPDVTVIEPPAGLAAGGETVIVRGLGFLNDQAGPCTVLFGGTPATGVTVLSDATLQCSVPAGAEGLTVAVEVSNANGAGRAEAAYRYLRAPLLTGLEPASGPQRGGNWVTVQAAALLEDGAGLPTVSFGGAPASDVEVLADDLLRCRAPAGPADASVDVVLSNANGSAALPQAYAYVVAPAVTAVTPAVGSARGGTSIMVLGSGFDASGAGHPEAWLGRTRAGPVKVLDDGRLLLEAPLGPPGQSVDVRVVTANGSALLADGFRYHELPGLASISPASGPEAGGTAVVVTGRGFAAPGAGLPRVRIGGRAATSVVVVDDEHLTCSTPAGSAGAAQLHLSTVWGDAFLPDAFVYGSTTPTLTSIDPEFGSSLGGTRVTLTGSGFASLAAGTSKVRFGAEFAASVSVLNDRTLVCTAPPGAPGTRVDVVLSNGNGTARLSQGWRHALQPTVTSLSPTSGSAAGGVLVQIRGSGFLVDDAGPCEVLFGSAAATAITVVDDERLSCRSPAGPAGAAVDVLLRNANGSVLLPDGWTFHVPPRLTAVSPAAGSSSGGTVVTLSGGGFAAGSAPLVRFGDVPATDVTVADDSTLSCTTPPVPLPGPTTVAVETDDGLAQLVDGYLVVAAPTIAAIAPADGPAGGGTPVVVTGSGFVSDPPGTTQVLFGTRPASQVTVQDDAHLTCLAPAGAPGSEVTVVVLDANGDSAGGPPFRYHPTPTLASVTPPHGYSGGATAVEVTGSGFLLNDPGLPEVRFGTRLASDVTVLDDSHLSCNAPPGPSGPASVRVRTANGQASLTEAFTYDWAPTLLAVAPVAGTSLGGTTVDLDGAGFDTAGAGLPVVHFGALLATGVEVLSGTRLRCVAPAGTAGSVVDVEITNAHGSATRPGAWSYHPLPRIDEVTPDHGPASGGTQVTVHGKGFVLNSAGPPTVVLDGTAATDVVVLDDLTLTCSVPAGPERTLGEVRVANANGEAVLGDAFRWVAPSAGDLDGDGRGDLVLGAAEGVYVVFSSAPVGLRTSGQCDLAVLSGGSLDLGASLVVADLDDDGHQDLVVGAPADSAAGAGSGSVLVFLGPLAPAPGPLSPSDADVVLSGEASLDAFGSALAVGDLDGDQRDDLVVGAPGNSTSGTGAGAAYVFLGKTGFASRSAALAEARFVGAAASDRFGAALACGDANGDGRDDLLVGAPEHRGNGSSSGAGYLFHGATPLSGRSADLASSQLAGEQSGDRLGTAVACADLDGDGRAELVLGAPESDRGGSRSGAVYVFAGSATPPSASVALATSILDGEGGGDRFGQTLATGDLDGDGSADLLVGAPQFDQPAASCGRAYALVGGLPSSGSIALRATTHFSAENSSGDQLGTALAALDLDGDGRAEALVGAPFHADGALDTGRSYVFDGATAALLRNALGADAIVRGELAGQRMGRAIGTR
jgi:PKD repeat protein